MAQELIPEYNEQGQLVGLSGHFSATTNGNGTEDHFQPAAFTLTVDPGKAVLATAVLTVDDWGYLDICSNGSTQRVIDLTDAVEAPGPRGGHVRWSASIQNPLMLGEGAHIITVRQDNAPYNEEYQHAQQYNVSFCQFSMTLEHKRINLMNRAEALSWITAYAPVNYHAMGNTEVYEYVGGELERRHKNDPKGYYYYSCALRVSIALTTLGIDYTQAEGADLYDNVEHLYHGHAIVAVTHLRSFLTTILGAPTYTDSSMYKKEAESEDIIVFAGGGHSGICMWSEWDKAGPYSFDEAIWVLNRTTWLDPNP